MALLTLQQFQHLFIQALNDPAGIRPPSRVVKSIAPGGTLNSETALEVYRTGHVVRLTEALGETFEAVWWVIGDTTFFRLAKDYLTLHPSTSYNLSDFGKIFPAFLADHHPNTDLPFLSDLARFEWLFKDVFHSPPHQPLSSDQFQQTSLSGDTQLTLAPSTHLFSSPYSVYEIWKLRETPQAFIPQDVWEQPQCLLCYQYQQQMYVQHVSRPDYHIIERLLQGDCIGDALQDALTNYPDLPQQMVSALFAWMNRTGLITGIHSKSSRFPNT